jgi:ribonuclease VapC
LTGLPSDLTAPIEVVAFSTQQAALAAALVRETQAEGLSLGDRACLARERGVRAVSADKSWRRLKLPIEIETIR